MSVEFCDTNVLAYAHDQLSRNKQPPAARLVGRLAESGEAALSVQVLQELFVTLTHKLPRPLPIVEARDLIADYATWRVFTPMAAHVIEAIDASARWQVSFWDAMVLTAARHSGAAILWSEGLSHGQRYDGVEVRNPFR
jgi:predicted nucleic acid-binding protein